MSINPDELEICLKVLQEVSEDPSVMNDHDRFKGLIAKIHRGGKKGERLTSQGQRKAHDRALKATTAMVQVQSGHLSPALLTDSSQQTHGTLKKAVNCYICKTPYTKLHFFYHQLCPKCADFNYRKRDQRADLTGRVVLLTGGRIKIGYQMALRLLRDGARVIVTTRFPADSAQRFRREPDFDTWNTRLVVHGLDLRNIPAVEAFTQYLIDTEPSLDIIINNAAQTVKRPLEFYQHLIDQERAAAQTVPLLESQQHYPPTLTNTSLYFPANTFDTDGQQIDKRPITSWLLKLDQVSTLEMLEVQLVNATAPFILNSRLKPLMLKSPFPHRFIINVSAMEGQYNRENKTEYHPHTNMAKAALNMMTRTSASDYARDQIFMNSVDTGWITDENPYPKRTHLQESKGFYAPLDVIDGMARIYDPIVQGLQNQDTPSFGHFLKDYAPYAW